MLAKRYLTSVKNLPQIMEKIREGTAPKKFTISHLKGIGFKSSNDQGILSVLKELKFLMDDGTPTRRYHDYRDRSQSAAIMAGALREVYEEIFHINEQPTEKDRTSIEGKFKSVHNVSDVVAKKQTMTFLALLKLADLDAESHIVSTEEDTQDKHETSGTNDVHTKKMLQNKVSDQSLSLKYNIEIHLPATKDIGVYNAIFKSLKEHILDD